MTFTADQTQNKDTLNHYVPQNLPTHIQHYINGEFVDSVGGKTFDVLDPVSNTNYATAAAGQKDWLSRQPAKRSPTDHGRR